MNSRLKWLSGMLLWSAAAAGWAQVPAAPAPDAAPATQAPGAAVPATPVPATAVPAASPAAPAPGSGVPARAKAAPPVRSTKTAAQAEAGEPRAGAASGKKPAAADRLDLGLATVTGDREQPKVLYIVPWKRSDIGDGSGKPMNSLLDEALAPVDRDEFKREVIYYNAVKADADHQGEK